MNEELNILSYNNMPITFSNDVTNIQTSDELEAAPLYQDKMGTAYSKSKALTRTFNLVGVSLVLTAAALKTGNWISNLFVKSPVIKDCLYQLENHVFSVAFTVSNPNEYLIYYYLFINENEVAALEGECSEEKEYFIKYDELSKGDNGYFYIEFDNKVDYHQIIESHKFSVED